MMFLARLNEPVFKAGEESLDCKLCLESEIPWSQIAFPTITYSLELFFKDRTDGKFCMHIGDLIREKSTRTFKFVYKPNTFQNINDIYNNNISPFGTFHFWGGGC